MSYFYKIKMTSSDVYSLASWGVARDEFSNVLEFIYFLGCGVSDSEYTYSERDGGCFFEGEFVISDHKPKATDEGGIWIDRLQKAFPLMKFELLSVEERDDETCFCNPAPV